MKKFLFTLLLLVVATPVLALDVIWDRSGPTDSSAYGYSILPLGDQNNDGFADWAVYARGNGGGYHGHQASYLEFFHGGNQPSATPYFTFRADTTLYRPLWFAYATGDLNGDGYQDWMLRLIPLNVPDNYSIPIYFGGPSADSTSDIQFPINTQTTVYPIGDFNRDGFGDLLCFNQETLASTIYYGGNPMDTLADWVLNIPPAGISGLWPYAIGDFNGDGASDFLCYNPNSPYAIAIFLGGSTPDTVPAYIWEDQHSPIGGVRSLNGDGADEFVCGGGLVHWGRPILTPTTDFSLPIPCSGPQQAISAGDFNHDGYNDLILLASYCSDNWFGGLNLYLGHPWINPVPSIQIDGWSEPLNLIGIFTAAGLGDVNGDGVDDIAIGAYHDTAYLGWRGRCIVVAGDPTLVADAEQPRAELPARMQLSVYPNPFNAQTTIQLEVPFGVNRLVLTTYNVLGQQVRQQELFCNPGPMHVSYDAHDLPTGIYILRAEAGLQQNTQKLMVLK